MEAERTDLDRAVAQYERALPEAVDLLLLGVGDDGHIASLFPGCNALQETRRKVMAVEVPKPPHRRMTVTPPVIQSASQRVVLAPGRTKAEVLRRVINDPWAQPMTLPATLALDAIWCVEDCPHCQDSCHLR
jgi:6-phosphogluconolactonase